MAKGTFEISLRGNSRAMGVACEETVGGVVECFTGAVDACVWVGRKEAVAIGKFGGDGDAGCSGDGGENWR